MIHQNNLKITQKRTNRTAKEVNLRVDKMKNRRANLILKIKWSKENKIENKYDVHKVSYKNIRMILKFIIGNLQFLRHITNYYTYECS
jgi:hypothetical protein